MIRGTTFKFLLFVAGDTQNSAQAVANLGTLCRLHLPDRHEIEIIDVFKDPKRAQAEGVFMTPTLVKLTPAPVKKIIGNLSQTEIVMQALHLEAAEA